MELYKVFKPKNETIKKFEEVFGIDLLYKDRPYFMSVGKTTALFKVDGDLRELAKIFGVNKLSYFVSFKPYISKLRKHRHFTITVIENGKAKNVHYEARFLIKIAKVLGKELDLYLAGNNVLFINNENGCIALAPFIDARDGVDLSQVAKLITKPQARSYISIDCYLEKLSFDERVELAEELSMELRLGLKLMSDLYLKIELE